MGVSNEKRNELQNAILNLFKIHTKMVPREAVYLSDLIADGVIAEGWQWHPKFVADPIQEPLADWEREVLDNGPWKDLEGIYFPEWEINEHGQIREKKTKALVASEYNMYYKRTLTKLNRPYPFQEQWVLIDGPMMADHIFKSAKKAPLPEEEVEFLDRIVHGLPLPSNAPLSAHLGEIVVGPSVDLKAVSKRISEEQGVDIEFVEPTWARIPGYRDYEVNAQGVVRNFWTKRKLGEYGKDKTVEIHGKDGSPFDVAVKALMIATFGPDWNKK